ncbi:hypothetical protein BG000_005694 [Podila horticola]|nr:hypothetical protein BG000_005694 [Podila horticola]
MNEKTMATSSEVSGMSVKDGSVAKPLLNTAADDSHAASPVSDVSILSNTRTTRHAPSSGSMSSATEKEASQSITHDAGEQHLAESVERPSANGKAPGSEPGDSTETGSPLLPIFSSSPTRSPVSPAAAPPVKIGAYVHTSTSSVQSSSSTSKTDPGRDTGSSVPPAAVTSAQSGDSVLASMRPSVKNTLSTSQTSPIQDSDSQWQALILVVWTVEHRCGAAHFFELLHGHVAPILVIPSHPLRFGIVLIIHRSSSGSVLVGLCPWNHDNFREFPVELVHICAEHALGTGYNGGRPFGSNYLIRPFIHGIHVLLPSKLWVPIPDFFQTGNVASRKSHYFNDSKSNRYCHAMDMVYSSPTHPVSLDVTIVRLLGSRCNFSENSNDSGHNSGNNNHIGSFGHMAYQYRSNSSRTKLFGLHGGCEEPFRSDQRNNCRNSRDGR